MKRNRYLLRRRGGLGNRYPDPAGRWRVRKSPATGYWMAWDADGIMRYYNRAFPFNADTTRS